MKGLKVSALSALFLLVSIYTHSNESGRPYLTTEQREPCSQYDPLRRAWFGDLHVHTAFSLDAAMQGTRTKPGDAYRYAKGESISIPPYGEDGQVFRRSQIDRPLDFLGVTDHAELLGELRICESPEMEGYDSWDCRMYRFLPSGFSWLPIPVGGTRLIASTGSGRLDFCGENGELCLNAAKGPWRENQLAAEEAYDRSENCSFTSFVGYEWTGNIRKGSGVANLHRNVIFRNAEVPELPNSHLESLNAPALWKHLEEDCSNAEGNCDAVVIPHNSNISMGLMFEKVRPDGQPITTEDAQRRQQYETLVEIIQHKGASECYFGPNATDELCNFEMLPWNNFVGHKYPILAKPIKEDAGHVREVLKEGLQLEQQLGVNPFKFGFIGSTDTHRSLAGGVMEKGFVGHGGAGNSAEDIAKKGLPDQWEFNPGGLAVLYAEENTRDALFAAMQRREAYATSGPRISVRFFGGWNYPEDMCEQNDFVAQGYALGVPMGGDLADGPDGPPIFAVWAYKDPGTAEDPGIDLQRVQIVKGWMDERGELHEKVFDIAGDPANGATVNLSNCEPQGTGYRKLCSVWVDPDFKKKQNAFYYSRVLENPSCRWSTHACNQQQVDCSDTSALSEELAVCCRSDIKKTIQERAWSSPIWYGNLNEE